VTEVLRQDVTMSDDKMVWAERRAKRKVFAERFRGSEDKTKA